jgi:transcriptional regulator with XRE-family HTH domain
MTPTVLNLAALRKAAGLSQADLADRVGCIQATISNLETGKSQRIELDLLDRLAGVLGCSPKDLIEKREK